MKKIFLILIIIINLASCNNIWQEYQDSNNKTYVRIVDANGKPKKIRTFTPELNIPYLAQNQQEFYPQAEIINAPEIKGDYDILNLENNLITSYNNPEEEVQDLNIKNNTESKINNIPTKMSKKPDQIIYDLSAENLTFMAEKKPKKVKQNNKSRKLAKGDLLIQIASFSSKNKAILAKNKNSKIQDARIISVKVGKKTYHKLVVGPFKNKKEGNVSLNNLRTGGYKDAFYYIFK